MQRNVIMVTIQVKNINGNTVLPVAGSAVAAGYDIVAIDDPVIIGEVGNVKDVNGKPVTFYRSIDYLEYHTQLFISPQASIPGTDRVQNFPCHTLIHPRSSVRKYNLLLANSIGLVDNDYRGEIIVCYKYVWQPDDLVIETVAVNGDGGNATSWEMTGRMLGKINVDKIFKKGDKICQLVAEQTIPATFVLVDELDKTARGAGGFGSTGIATPKKDIPVDTTKSSGEAFKKLVDSMPGASLEDIYKKAGGIPTKKRYSDEVRERNK